MIMVETECLSKVFISLYVLHQNQNLVDFVKSWSSLTIWARI